MTERTQIKPTEDDRIEHDAALERRRRLLKLGVSATPVILTLSSRSVLACHCKSPSAAGSVTFASHRPKNDPNWDDGYGGFDISGVKTYAEWMSQSGTLPGGITKDTAVGSIPDGIGAAFSNDATKIRDLPLGFKRDIVTAYLNLKFVPVAAANCLKLDQLKVMASGSYIDPANNVHYGQAEIQNYLKDNWLLGYS